MSEKTDTVNLRFGPNLLDLASRQLLRDGEALPIQPRVFNLLTFLAQNAHRAVDKDELQDVIWPGQVITEAALARAVMKARKAVNDDATRQAVIKTVHGHGYHFVANVELEPAASDASLSAPLAVSGTSIPAAEAAPSMRRGVGLVATAAVAVLVATGLWRVFSPIDSVNQAPDIDETAQSIPVTLDRQSIAVLPFANRSDLTQDQYFADGIQDDLLTLLSKVGSLKVISRTSMMRYRDDERSIPEIAKALGVANILEGGIQRSAGQVRVNVQLIDANTDQHIWAETFDRKLNAENLFAIQSEISHHIVDSLQAAMDDHASQTLNAPPTDNLDAYAAFVQGRQALARRTKKSLSEARTHFEQAVELDPAYTLAYVGVADTLNLLSTYGTASQAGLWPRRQSMIDRALELNPQSGEAWTALAALRVDQDRSEEAERHFRQAIQYSPNYATAYHWYAYLLENAGRAEEALPLIRRALELDPMASILTVQYARVLWKLGRVEGANAALLEGLRRDPQFLSFYLNMANNLREMGDLAVSMQWIQAGLKLDPTLFPLQIMACKRHLDFDDEAAAVQCFDQIEETFPEASIGGRLELHEFRGNFDLALEEAQALESRWPMPFARLTVGRNLLHAGYYQEVVTLLDQHWPELLTGNSPSPTNLDQLQAAVLAGRAYWYLGEKERANDVLDQALAYMTTLPRVRGDGYGELDVTIHVLRGEHVQAITALQDAVDAGWRDNWWRLRYPSYRVMDDSPQWRTIVAELEAGAARSREQYVELKNEGASLF
ncbi:MAG: tetratricopeptide repeat protein [Lysobacterales bacterium]